MIPEAAIKGSESLIVEVARLACRRLQRAVTIKGETNYWLRSRTLTP